MGLPIASWLRDPGWPGMVAFHRLPQRPYKSVRREWALDSGAFSHLAANGRWVIKPATYATAVERWSEAGLAWAATQDWLCAPTITHRTGRTVEEHQKLTLDSWHLLRALAPDVHWVPTVQGWHPDQYLAHVDMYGPELFDEPLVGVGSIAGRQGGSTALQIVHELAELGLALHGWGVKSTGLRQYGPLLASADSQAWSAEARHRGNGCGYHDDCRNCPAWAERWAVTRQHEMDTARAAPRQLRLV